MEFSYKDKHNCEAILITCIDFRFHQATIQYLKENLIEDFDLLTIPGVAKNFVENNIQAKEAIRIIKEVSISLHQVKKIIVMAHWDCGGYGGSQSFASAEEEENKYQADLQKAKEILTQEFSELEILIGYSKIIDNQIEFFMID